MDRIKIDGGMKGNDVQLYGQRVLKYDGMGRCHRGIVGERISGSQTVVRR